MADISLSSFVGGVPGPEGPPGPAGTGTLLSVLNSDVVSIPPGTPVAMVSAGAVVRADKDALARKVVGLVDTTAITAGGNGFIRTEGELVLTTGQWDAVTGNVGGLAPTSDYYVSAQGILSNVPPSGAGFYSCTVGKAITPTKMLIEIQTAYQL